MERETNYGFIIIEKPYIGRGDNCELVYDPITKVCYIIIDGYHIAGITPYYIIGKDGKPEIAIYGVNYEKN